MSGERGTDFEITDPTVSRHYQGLLFILPTAFKTGCRAVVPDLQGTAVVEDMWGEVVNMALRVSGVGERQSFERAVVELEVAGRRLGGLRCF